MPAPSSFDYAVLRIVPRVEREEFFNAGVVLWCITRQFLGVRVFMDEAKLLALDPAADPWVIRDHLEAFERVASGDPGAGPLAKLAKRERFHWLVAPRSTIIQVSATHTGLCEDPAEALERLFQTLVWR